MNSYQDFKSFYQSNILLFIILLFIIVYLIINWSVVLNGNYFGGVYTKSILITGIIFLIFHMIITWDDNINDSNDEIIDIPKYKLQNNLDNININKNEINPQILPNPQGQQQAIEQSLNTKYKIFNKFNIQPNPIQNNINNLNKFNNYNNNSNDDSRLSNKNIFISHKNSSKYGLKF